MGAVKYRTVDVDGLKIFYREAGAAEAPSLLLLHGFPSAGHMFRNLIPLLADLFHIIAPDLPWFWPLGHATARNSSSITRSTASQGVIDRFTEIWSDLIALRSLCLRLRRADRLPARDATPPERITAIISQNGNAYEEGLERRLDPHSRLIGKANHRPTGRRFRGFLTR